MDEIENFWRGHEETTDLFNRLPAAFPQKRDIAKLKARWDDGDRNVVKTDREEYGGVSYNLRFTPDQLSELERAYIAAHPGRPNAIRNVDDVEFEASVFVRIIEGWADAIDDFDKLTPETQKDRKRTLNSISLSIMKLDQALSELDSEALGYWYGHVVDALAISGIQLSEADNRMSSMLNHPLRAVVEGGELRKDLRAVIGVIVKATESASEGLPKHNHAEHDPRLKTAKALEQLIIDHGIPFDSTETGFAAISLRAMFDLAGLDIEKVSYWLKKVEDDPDSYARFLLRMRGQS